MSPDILSSTLAVLAFLTGTVGIILAGKARPKQEEVEPVRTSQLRNKWDQTCEPAEFHIWLVSHWHGHSRKQAAH